MSSKYNVDYVESVSPSKQKFQIKLTSFDYSNTLSPKEHCEYVKNQLSIYVDQYVERYGADKTKCEVYFTLSCEDKKN